MQFGDIEFIYEEHIIQKVDEKTVVDVYDNVQITKGNDKYPLGYKVNQISILKIIRFENKDGSENRGFLTANEIDSDNREKLIDEHLEAVAKARIENDWITAANHYSELGKLENLPTHYAEAGDCFKRMKDDVENLHKAIDSYRLAAEFYAEFKQYGMVARYYNEIAEIYENIKNKSAENAKFNSDILEAYKKAKYYFELDNKPVNGNKCAIKIAEYEVLNGNYTLAAEILESVGIFNLDSALGKFTVKTYFLNSLLCLLSSDNNQNTREKIRELSQKCPEFADTREYLFISELTQIVRTNSPIQSFDKTVSNYSLLNPFTELQTPLIDTIRGKLSV